MNSIRYCRSYYTNHYYNCHSPFHSKFSNLVSYKRLSSFYRPKTKITQHINYNNNVVHLKRDRLFVVRACNINEEMNERLSFLSLEEAGLVEISGLNTHERFLCRLTISSLNLLRVIAEQEGCKIEELNAGRVSDWFLKDKLKREQDIGSAVLQWDDEDPFDLQF